MTNCRDCSDNSISLTGSWFTNSPCYSSDCGGSEISASCVIYNGGNLTCSGIDTGDNLETALQKIDTQICEIIGDYSTYNMHCLPDWWEAPITTQEDFVDAITEFVCDLEVTTNTFITNEFVTFQTTIYEIIETIEFPGITCLSASVINTDSITQVLTKYCTKFGEIDDALNISSVVWNDCMTVVGTPSTLSQGFQLLADQICTVYDLATGGALPLFNNYGSCIGGTSSDSLVTTVGLIKTRLCLTDVVNFEDIIWDCWGTGATTMQQFVAKTVSYLNTLNSSKYQFNLSDFVLTPASMDPCQGQLVSLATPINQDRFVAVSALDASPGTLITKVASSGGTIVVSNNADTTLNLEIATGDRGDITVSSGGTAWTIDNDVVTFAKMQNINTDRLLGRSTVGSGDTEEISIGSGLLLSAGVLSATGAGLFTFANGLTETSGIVHLGGVLVEDTDIYNVENEYSMSFTNMNIFTVTASNIVLTCGGFGATEIGGKIGITSYTSPTAILANQNNYGPTGFSSNTVFRLSSDASRNITGLEAGNSGRLIYILNVGAFDIVLKDEDASSLDLNRFALVADITLRPDEAVQLWYDETSERWRAFGKWD